VHPNLYLRTFWTAAFRPEVFVAMSFDPAFDPRFKEVIEPAIESVEHRGVKLCARRVDLLKSGDSILSEISDGIAHSVMVLADVSLVGYDSKTGKSYRNGNVMYEVGLALASRQSAEVLLIRDDRDAFLFDVSTVPHMHLDFSDAATARVVLANEIGMRLREVNRVFDARVSLTIASLTAGERTVLAAFAEYGMDQTFWLSKESLASITPVARLLDKQLIRTRGATSKGSATFGWTELGRIVADNLDRLSPVLQLPDVEAASAEDADLGRSEEPEGGTEQARQPDKAPVG
jgi:hypothetical protein